VGERSKLIEKL